MNPQEGRTDEEGLNVVRDYCKWMAWMACVIAKFASTAVGIRRIQSAQYGRGSSDALAGGALSWCVSLFLSRP